jgi:hypothetical protein
MTSTCHRFSSCLFALMAALAAPVAALGCAAATDATRSDPLALEVPGLGAPDCPWFAVTEGSPCSSEGLLCAWGYRPRDCSGVTFRCDDGAWVEASRKAAESTCQPVYSAADGCGPYEPPVPSDADAGRWVGGECTYTTTPGYIVVTSIDEAPAGEANCSVRPRAVRAAFYDKAGNYVRDERVTIGAGSNPPESCLEGEGLRVGAHLPATLRTITAGTCNPLFVTLDAPLAICERDCW